jgi:polar amino acid transport system substrate-binding protein
MIRRLLSLALAVGCLGVLLPASDAHAEATKLRVAVVPLEPFVARSGDKADGMYIEIWNRVAENMGRSTEFVWVDKFADLLPAVADGRADVAVAPFGLTSEREMAYDFSAAVMRSGPQLGVAKRLATKQSLVRALFSPAVLRLLMGAFVVLIVLAHIMWLVERTDEHSDPHFRKKYPHGMWDGFWWAAVTIATVGYGDKAPKSVRGRLVGLLAILCSLFTVGAFVSQVTSSLTSRDTTFSVSDLNSARKHDIGAINGSTFLAYLESQGVTAKGFATQQALFEAVDKREVDVVVTNPYALKIVGPRYGVVSVGNVLYEEFVTFGFAQGSPLREETNKSLASLQAKGVVSAIVDRWTK